jgi:hypothetical protein
MTATALSTETLLVDIPLVWPDAPDKPAARYIASAPLRNDRMPRASSKK